MKRSRGLVLFDTSFWRSLSIRAIEIFYPQSNWIWTVTVATETELNDTEDKTDKDRKIVMAKFKKLLMGNVKIMKPPGEVISEEIKAKLNGSGMHPDFPLESDAYQSKRRVEMTTVILGGKHRGMGRSVAYLRRSENEIWQRMPRDPGRRGVVSIEEFERRLEWYFSTENPLPIGGRRLGWFIGKLGKDRVQAECPAVVATMRLSTLYDCLSRPKETETGFAIDLFGHSIGIQKSTITDAGIASPYLNYVDEFATFDTGQAALLKHLHPQHERKVRLFLSSQVPVSS